MLNPAGHAALFGYPLRQFDTYWQNEASPLPTLPTPLNQQSFAQEKVLAQEQEAPDMEDMSPTMRISWAPELKRQWISWVKEQSAEAQASEQEKVAREKVAEAPPSAEAADVPPASASMQPHVDSQEAEYVDSEEQQQKLSAEQSKQWAEEAEDAQAYVAIGTVESDATKEEYSLEAMD